MSPPRTSTKQTFHIGTGRRKTAVARVRLTEGKGKVIINDRDLKSYFPHVAAVEAARAPLQAVGCDRKVDVFIRVSGGGCTSQAGAVQLGIARALLKSNPDFEETLRENKFLTRDARKKERKKYGRAGARRSFQFSKR